MPRAAPACASVAPAQRTSHQAKIHPITYSARTTTTPSFPESHRNIVNSPWRIQAGALSVIPERSRLLKSLAVCKRTPETGGDAQATAALWILKETRCRLRGARHHRYASASAACNQAISAFQRYQVCVAKRYHPSPRHQLRGARRRNGSPGTESVPMRLSRAPLASTNRPPGDLRTRSHSHSPRKPGNASTSRAPRGMEHPTREGCGLSRWYILGGTIMASGAHGLAQQVFDQNNLIR